MTAAPEAATDRNFPLETSRPACPKLQEAYQGNIPENSTHERCMQNIDAHACAPELAEWA